jgi:hypothetical protein
MMNELEQAFLKAIREGDTSAAKAYADWLEEKGCCRPRYLVRITDEEIPVSVDDLSNLQREFQRWLNNEIPLLFFPPGMELVLVTDRLQIVMGTGEISPVNPHHQDVFLAAHVGETVVGVASRALERRMLDNHVMGFVHNDTVVSLRDDSTVDSLLTDWQNQRG